MNGSFEKATVGEIVAADFRAGAVFEGFGIDFCCGGRRSVEEACRTAGADPEAVERALHALPPSDEDEAGDMTRWPLDRLIDLLPELSSELLERAKLYEKLGAPSAALSDYERYLSAEPDGSDRNLAKQAIARLERALGANRN